MSGGRSPKQLKPFLQAAQQESNSPSGQPTSAHATTQQPNAKPDEKPIPRTNATATPQVPSTTAQPQQPASMTELLRQKSTEGKRISTIGNRPISISIRQSAEAQQAARTSTATAPTYSAPRSSMTVAEPTGDQPISESELNFYWHEYIGQMPKEQIAFAKRMQNIHLALSNEATCQIPFDNELAAKDFQGILPTIQGYLRSRLRNNKLTLQVHVTEAEEQTRAVSRNEKLQLMSDKNQSIQLLISTFGLEFN